MCIARVEKRHLPIGSSSTTNWNSDDDTAVVAGDDDDDTCGTVGSVDDRREINVRTCNDRIL